MKHADCTGCGLPVLELEGQFELMQAHELESRELPAELAGWWHTACLIESSAASAWAAVRQHMYREVRGYEVVAELDGWIVLQHARGDRIAIGRNGERIGLAGLGSKKRSRKVPGGRVFTRVDDGYNLDVKERDVIPAIREGFAKAGSYPLLSVFELLGIRERVQHPVALEQGSVAAVREADSKHFITMRLEYGVFVPDALLPFLVPGA